MNAFLALKREDMSLIARSLGFRHLAGLIGRNVLDINHYYALEIRLNRKLPTQSTRLSGGILTLMGDGDIDLLKKQLSTLNNEDRAELLSRILFLERGFKNCYAYKLNGAIAYMQWLIYPDENPRLQTSYPRRFLTIKQTQVMLENAFTFPRYRGFGLMQFVSSELLKKASEQGHEVAIAYVIKENFNSLNHLLQLGFKIRRLVPEYKFCGYVWRKW